MNLFSKARPLAPNEWDRLTPLAEHFGGSIPPPEAAQVFVVELGKEIVGLITLEKIIHVGPVWVKPEHQGRGIFNSLFSTGFRNFPQLRGAVCFTTNSKMVRFVKRLNLREIISQRVFVWEK